MSTARDLLMSSLRLIGVLASGESLSSSEATDGLSALNNLLDSWSTENLLIPNKVREVFPLVPSQASYTMGTAGNFNTTRPMQIEEAFIQLTSSNPVIELPVRILTKEQFASILIKQLSSTLPTDLYAEGTYPLETLNLWPVPSSVNNLVLYSSKPLAELTTLGTALSLPPGYERALRFNLALELSPEYGRAVPDVVALTASDSKANLKRQNAKPKYLRVDDALLARGAVWNWMTGEPT